ncbi:catalase-like domain-containing protein [Halenospora varia]|nr:catalase-like domain-containing protein [Halenospora varia]
MLISKIASNGTNGHTNGLASRTKNYIRWDAEGVEKIPPNDAEDIQVVADMINKIQRAQYNNHRYCYSGTHARTQGIVKGKMITELFSKPGEFPIAMRYSTEPGDPGLDDRIPQPRGLGMKVFNVQGDMFEAGQGWPTHDIEFNSTPALDLADAKTTKEIIDFRIKYGGDKKELYKHLEARKDTDMRKALDQVKNTHLSSTRQYSQTAYRFVDYVVKYCLVPSSETQKKQAEETNLEDQLVEYAGKIWDPEKYPCFIPARKTFWEDHIRLDPCQPLGSPNRLRKVVYPASAALRHKRNGRKEINMTSIDQLPDGGYVEC